MPTNNALQVVREEIAYARGKFPGNDRLLLALAEEVGELAEALEFHGNRSQSYGEAKHVACVAVRIMTEGDGDYQHATCITQFGILLCTVGELAKSLLEGGESWRKANAVALAANRLAAELPGPEVGR